MFLASMLFASHAVRADDCRELAEQSSLSLERKGEILAFLESKKLISLSEPISYINRGYGVIRWQAEGEAWMLEYLSFDEAADGLQLSGAISQSGWRNSRCRILWHAACALGEHPEKGDEKTGAIELERTCLYSYSWSPDNLLGVMQDSERFLPFFHSLPQEAIGFLYEQWLALLPEASVPESEVPKLLRIFRGSALGAARLAEFEDWHVFEYDFLVNGHPAEALARMHEGTSQSLLLQGIIALKAGDAAQAVKLMRAALRAQHTATGTRDPAFQRSSENLFYGLALLADRKNPATVKVMRSVINRFDGKRISDPQALITVFCAHGLYEDPIDFLQNWALDAGEADDPRGWNELLINTAGAISHTDAIRTLKHAVRLSAMASLALKICPVMLAQFIAASGPELAKTSPGLMQVGKDLEAKLGMKPLSVYERKLEPGESVLCELIESSRPKAEDLAPKKAGLAKAERVAYLVDSSYRVTPRLQKSRNGTTWTAGKNIPLAEFIQGIPAPTEQDRAVATLASLEPGSSSRFMLQGEEVLYALRGHPFVFRADDKTKRIEIEELPLSVSVLEDKKNGSYRLKTNLQNISGYTPGSWHSDHFPYAVRSYEVQEEYDTRWKAVRVSDEEQHLISSMTRIGAFPREAKGMLTELLENISARTAVMSPLLRPSKTLAWIPGESGIVLQISPAGTDKFSVRAAVRPVKDAAVSIGGKPAQAERDIKAEKRNLETASRLLEPIESCREDRTHWTLGTADCLRLLEIVRENPQVCSAEWPKGEKLAVKQAPASFSDLSLSIRSAGWWLETSGELKLADGTKLKAAELLERVRSANRGFIALSGHEYLELTQSLRKQLELLGKLAGSGKKLQVSLFNAPAIDALADAGADATGDEAYKALLERIESAESLAPKVPSSVTAELRDYQTDGFEWMARLAAWGAGALLADDMGLGKTVQAIALLALRAKSGPQLAATPASVLCIWRDELAKFAPAIRCVILNTASDREKALQEAAPGTEVLTTYGVMTAEAEALSAVSWTTAVFDEAHALKNRATKAFRAACCVRADFRMLLTGTPLQNHLTEIWALFEIAVPGLLGPFTRFSERFVLPIERDGDRGQLRLLKRLVSPFILRRTKSAVLDELPGKTEITMKVVLSEAELALYEQIREEAQASLETGETNPVQALAALTRLRQAACSPELIDPALKIPSSKTAAFLELADDLIAARHRALVFSQFTSHLALIRRELDKKGLRYLYLDGSMSPAERLKLVAKFEEGDMPLFLISL